MIVYQDPVMQLSLSELVDEVASRTGFTPSQVDALIDCDLEVKYLLEYVTAVVTNSMN